MSRAILAAPLLTSRAVALVVVSWLAVGLAPASAQVAPAPPSEDPGAFAASSPGFVEDNFYGPEIRLQNTTPTANIELEPLTPREFFQAPELTDPSGDLERPPLPARLPVHRIRGRVRRRLGRGSPAADR